MDSKKLRVIEAIKASYNQSWKSTKQDKEFHLLGIYKFLIITEMDTSIKAQLKEWAEMSNNNPLDNERLYEIAISTYANKIEQDVFQDITGEILFEKYYTIYEQLINFVKYLKGKDMLKH